MSTFLLGKHNLADLDDVEKARDHLGLGSLALLDESELEIDGGTIKVDEFWLMSNYGDNKILKSDHQGKAYWGYVTVKAAEVEEDYSEKSLQQLQKLVEKIYDKTQLKFWDCHWWNIGIIKYRKKPRVVCIDTGSESFIRDYNAWGFNTPGPRCDLCDKYQCKCGV